MSPALALRAAQVRKGKGSQDIMQQRQQQQQHRVGPETGRIIVSGAVSSSAVRLCVHCRMQGLQFTRTVHCVMQTASGANGRGWEGDGCLIQAAQLLPQQRAVPAGNTSLNLCPSASSGFP